MRGVWQVLRGVLGLVRTHRVSLDANYMTLVMNILVLEGMATVRARVAWAHGVGTHSVGTHGVGTRRGRGVWHAMWARGA